MRFGIICDLHLGHQGQGRWHNRLLYDHATEITQAAVASLNRQRLDWTMVLGDITNDGEPAQVQQSVDILSALRMPWYAIPGNHDAPAVRSGLFDEAFQDHAVAGCVPLGEVWGLFLRDGLENGLKAGDSGFALGAASIRQAVQAVKMARPPRLLIFSHLSLVPEGSFAAARGGLYAGDYADGPELLDGLAEMVPGRIAVFCGHQHWHHVTESSRWVQCTTAAMIEYPMEMRQAVLEEDALYLSVVQGTSPTLAAESLDAADWVQGARADRWHQVQLAR